MSLDDLKALYRDMVTLREFDELALALKKKDIIYSGYHPYIGQEAVAVGFCGALEEKDVLLSTHRAHCHAILTLQGCKQTARSKRSQSTRTARFTQSPNGRVGRHAPSLFTGSKTATGMSRLAFQDVEIF